MWERVPLFTIHIGKGRRPERFYCSWCWIGSFGIRFPKNRPIRPVHAFNFLHLRIKATRKAFHCEISTVDNSMPMSDFSTIGRPFRRTCCDLLFCENINPAAAIPRIRIVHFNQCEPILSKRVSSKRICFCVVILNPPQATMPHETGNLDLRWWCDSFHCHLWSSKNDAC